MENEIKIKGSVRPHRCASRLHIAAVMMVVINIALIFLAALSLIVAGEPLLAAGPLLGLLISAIRIIRSSRKPSKADPRSFTASAAGIDFTGTEAVIGWNQIRKWSRKPKGILVILKSDPYGQQLSFPVRVLGHDNGFAFLLRPDASQSDKETAYTQLIQLLDQNTKDRKERDHDHV